MGCKFPDPEAKCKKARNSVPKKKDSNPSQKAHKQKPQNPKNKSPATHHQPVAAQPLPPRDVLHTFSAAVATRATRRKVSLLLYGEGLPMGLPQGARAFAEVLNISALPGWAARQRWLPGEP